MILKYFCMNKNVNGIYEIDVSIDGKMYTYYISSEYAVRMFLSHYRNKKRHGRALSILNKFKVIL